MVEAHVAGQSTADMFPDDPVEPLAEGEEPDIEEQVTAAFGDGADLDDDLAGFDGEAEQEAFDAGMDTVVPFTGSAVA